MAQEIADSTLLDTWASSGLIVEPDISKIIEGWQLGEQPPHEYMNWLQNTFGSKLNHILKNGIPKWNNKTEYLAGSSVQHNGNVWLCRADNTNSEPTDINNSWENTKSNKSANTINDLKTKSGDVINVLGYHTKGDGGGGLFYWDAASTETDNGGTIIQATGITTGRWKRLYSGAVNVKWFGAKGDGVTDDTAIFSSIESSIGCDVDLKDSIYKTTHIPNGCIYFNGGFLVDGRSIYKPKHPQETPFGKCNIKPLISSQDSHVGFNSGLLDASTEAESKVVVVYRRATSHGLINGSQIMAADSYDSGQTLVNHRVIYQTASYDTRSFSSAKMDNGRIGLIATRRDSNAIYTDPVFIYSDDRGVTWNSVVITMPISGSKVNFHGALLKYPTSAGGNDVGGWIAYSYGVNQGVDAFYTTNNGESWSVLVDVAVPDTIDPSNTSALTYALSETTVCKAGHNKWIMFCRNASPTTISRSNAVAYKSTDMLNWSGPYDTGLLLANNPPEAIYDGGRVWLMSFSRQGGRWLKEEDASTFVVADARAEDLFNADCSFTKLNRHWNSITSIPNWASGYLNCFKIQNKWYGSFVCQERTIIGQRTVLALIGDFIPTTVSMDDVKQISPNSNGFINGGFDIWQRGVYFSNTVAAYTADRWQASGFASGTETNVVTRMEFAVNPVEFRDNPKYYLKTHGTARSNRHWIAQRIEGVGWGSGETVTLSFWARAGGGATVPIDEIRAIQNFGTGGTPSTATSTVFGSNLTVSGIWRKFELTATLPSISDKVLGTEGNDYLWIIFYTGLGEYNIQYANMKIEKGGTATPFVRLPIDKEIRDCQRFFQKSYALNTAPASFVTTAGAFTTRAYSNSTSFGVTFNIRTQAVMRTTPTVKIYSPDTGNNGFIRDATGALDIPANTTNISDNGFVIYNTEVGIPIGNLVRVHYTAEAEL